jgi:phenylalanyl-tRNA synthetase beta chain
MQFSEHWLRSLVDPPLTSGELAHALTMAGLEVEAVEPVAPPFSGVVVAQVLSVEKHPQADRLRLCSVDAAQGDTLRIVCGAPNVATGMKVPCALVGAQLPGLSIKLAKVRGVESFGMLCSARELGLSEEQGGLIELPADAPVGSDLRDYLALEDKTFSLKLTPNRSDCLCLKGIAREVAALTGAALSLPAVREIPASTHQSRAVVLDAPQACPRYCGRVISGIDPAAGTPEWMRQRLSRSGLRAIGAVVDVTNYVMLELGQPLHAFDNAKLTGDIHVRYPKQGETLLLLNGQSVEPSADTLLICDEAAALALAGIMGGEASGVSAATTDLFLESAFFAPEAVAGKARALGFSSDASYRFERGVDFAGAKAAMERATELILQICGGIAGPITDAQADLPERHPIRLRSRRVERVLGVHLEPSQIESLLAGLGFAVSRQGEDFQVVPTSFRFDIAIEEDLIEELARLHGYDNIPARIPRAALAMLPVPEERRLPRQVRELMATRDYQEVVNFSFVDAQWETDFCSNGDPVRLANPIASHMSVMRTSLIGGLVANLSSNLNRRVERVRIFEIGRCYLRDGIGEEVAGYRQPLRLGVLCAGVAVPKQWGSAARNADFFDVKGDVEALVSPRAASFERVEHPALHPGRSAAIVLDGLSVGIIGEIHPRWVDKYELSIAPVIVELDMSVLLQACLPRYVEVSRFPAVMRDLALVVAEDLPAGQLLEGLRRCAPAIVVSVELFDLYIGEGIEAGRKSLAFRVVMQDTRRTLADAEVDAALAVMIGNAEQEYAARLRA